MASLLNFFTALAAALIFSFIHEDELEVPEE